MDGIYEFIRQIGNLLLNIFQFVIDLFQDIVYLVKITGQVVLQIPAYFSFLPGEFISILVVIFGIVVLYKVLGREG